MKSHIKTLVLAALGMSASVGQAATYTNFVRQVLLQSIPAIYWDVSVEPKGERFSPVAIDLAGSRYELWTIENNGSKPPVSYLLDTAYVSAFAPEGDIVIKTLDPDGGSIPRTRADQPFSVDIQIKGLRNGLLDPPSSKSVRLLHHTQSYGTTNGENIDRSKASLFSQAIISTNGKTTLNYAMTNIAGTDLTKVRGEERFSIYTRKDDGSLDEQICSRYVKVWPLTKVSIVGVDQDSVIRFKAPEISIVVEDVYPKSYTYTQIYQGPQKLGTVGTVIPSAQLQRNDITPHSDIWKISNVNDYIDKEGTWTMEVITETVFGRERLSYVTFNVDRELEVNSLLSTLE